MLKEIFEQPETSRTRCAAACSRTRARRKLGGLNLTDEELLQVRQHRHHRLRHDAGTRALIGEYMIEELARIPVEVEYASEFRYRNPIVNERTLCIVISQSGETADTLAAMREAKRRGARTLGLVNVVGSTIAREVGRRHLPARRPGDRRRVDQGVHQPGHRARAAHAQARPAADISHPAGPRDHRGTCRRCPAQIQQILDRAAEIEELAERFERASNFLYLGRGYNFPVALEGALKLKEISYIHAEGYPAAEMKHGPIALIDEMMPVVFIAPHDSVFDKVVSNMQEVKARGGKVIALVNDCDPQVERLADACIEIPETIDMLTPMLASSRCSCSPTTSR